MYHVKLTPRARELEVIPSFVCSRVCKAVCWWANGAETARLLVVLHTCSFLNLDTTTIITNTPG